MSIILRMENKTTEQHPLNDQWSWWEHRKANSEEDYSNNTVRCADFETVEGFWQCMNHIPAPSEFFYNGRNNRKFKNKEGSKRHVISFSVFRRGIHPSWEDDANRCGGDFTFKKFRDIQKLDEIWEESLLHMISGHYPNIVGTRIVDTSVKGKNLYKLEIWFSPTNAEESLKPLMDTINDDYRLKGYYTKYHSN